MLTQSGLHQPRPRMPLKAVLSPHVLAVACGAVLAITSALPAQQAPIPYDQQQDVFPEVILAPMQVNGIAEIGAGWILIYRNTLAGPSAPEIEVQTRNVPLAERGKRQESASISWEIVRTRNDICTEAGAGPCPDRIRVMSVPEGFLAIPEQAWVDEGTIMSIRIVPALLG